MRATYATGLALTAALLSFAPACPSAETVDAPRGREASMLALEVQGDAEVEKYDLNGDGEADVWKYFNRVGPADIPRAQRTRLLAKKDMDLNYDGTVDMTQHYNKLGDVVREEMDLDFDSKKDATDYYLDGKLYKRIIYLNFVDRASMWKYYDDGRLTRKESDTNDDGRPDLFEYYVKGKLQRIGYDRDGDGKPDTYDEVAGAERGKGQ